MHSPPLLALVGVAMLAQGAAAGHSIAVLADCGHDPMRALHSAVTSLRAQRAGSTATRAMLTIRGTCRLAAPLELDAQDSNVQWVGEGAAAISGGIDLPDSAWSKYATAQCTGCGTVWVARLNGSTYADSRQLYVDGIRANRTVMQFPQASATKHALGIDSPLAAWFTHNRGAKIEMLHRGTHTCNYSSSIQWAETRVPVARIKDQKTFVMLQPAYSHSNNNGNRLPCFLENAFELLGDREHGRPGDYYIDSDAKSVYYVGVTAPKRAVLPQSEGLVTASNITDWSVQGVSMQEATWQLDDSGFMHCQSGTYVKGPLCGTFNASDPSGKNASGPCPSRGFDAWAIIPAAVQVHKGRNVVFHNCTFRRLGATGVAFDSGSQNCTVASSLLTDISGNGVQIGQINSYNISNPVFQDADNQVIDTVVKGVGIEWLGTCGIIAFYSRGTRILHNEVAHVPYTGISVGWGWTRTMEVTCENCATATSAPPRIRQLRNCLPSPHLCLLTLGPRMPWDRNNVVEYNNVHSIDGIMGDGGAM